MTSDFLQTASAGLIVLGTLLTTAGGFGQYYFGKRMEKEKEAAQQAVAAQLQTSSEAAKVLRMEEERRTQVLARLRTLYLASHDAISPEMLAGLAPLPKDWVEKELEKLGERWRQDSYR